VHSLCFRRTSNGSVSLPQARNGCFIARIVVSARTGTGRTETDCPLGTASQGAGNQPFDFVGYLQTYPEAIALLGYREETLRAWNLSAGSIDGVAPSRSIIYAGAYPGSRALYLYANTDGPMRAFIYSILWSVGGARGDTVVIIDDSAEQRNLREHVWTLPDLKL
jgi:hypothetical protein